MSSTDIKELYEKYGFLIYGRCLRILGSEDEARDAMQTVFMKLIENISAMRDRERIVPWIFNTAKNHCFNLIRYNKKFAREIETDGLAGNVDFEKQLSARQIIQLAASSQNRKVRDAVYYTYVEELEQSEIQKLTGQSPATIRRNLAKFRDRVRRIEKSWTQA